MKIKGIQHELLYENNKLSIVYPKEEFETYEQIYGDVFPVDESAEYEVIIKKKRKKRSLNANAYSWVLTGKLADKLNIGKDECHSLMLARYGQTATDKDGNAVIVSVRADIPQEVLTHNLGYVAPLATHSFINDKEFIHYRVLRGSSEYDSSEMAHFIDGIVSECKEVGIETLTPNELAQLKADWGNM